MADDRLSIETILVRRLVAAQFPQWADLAIRRVPRGGWDNFTFRLGEKLSVRLPSAQRYVTQVAKEHEWLPRLAPHLTLPIPRPLARGEPGEGYPWQWSIYRWIEGEPADVSTIGDMAGFARDLAAFLNGLYAIDASGGPRAGAHNFHRGGSLAVYDGETRRAVAALAEAVDADELLAIWETALASKWENRPAWVHGDVAAGNLLTRDGRLVAVIDFGSSAVGDPACDLAIAWTFLDRDSRGALRAALPFDAATWQRGCGWAVWKALVTLAAHGDSSEQGVSARRTLAAILDDHRRG